MLLLRRTAPTLRLTSKPRAQENPTAIAISSLRLERRCSPFSLLPEEPKMALHPVPFALGSGAQVRAAGAAIEMTGDDACTEADFGATGGGLVSSAIAGRFMPSDITAGALADEAFAAEAYAAIASEPAAGPTIAVRGVPC